ncbi:uncharacterized protein LOC128860135 isoform X2 [Anastrepha ludens]|uniref:uncharacterized protein LOC128860135 isoform X2 n=1 Tax=Anastrepha ludens TaxID=28586 RepID=UPI0023AFB4EB|nr:uncharacterized protein LOC128860135 isoform X2 [Anastrepha ludens]
MKQIIFASILVMLLFNLQRLHAAPPHPNDIDFNDSSSGGGIGGGGGFGNLFRGNNNPQMDYNMLVTHLRDFFMYLPVMMTSLRESMSGFPKFAEGIRILTSKTGRLEGPADSSERRGNFFD